MITVIRRQLIENNVYKSIVWAMLMLMVLSLGLPTFVTESSKKNSWIAFVNDAPIPYEDYARKVADYEYKIRMFRQQFGNSFMSNLNPHALALDHLVRNALIGQVAEKLTLSIDEEVLSTTLSDADFVYQELSDLVPPEAFDPSTGIKNEPLQRHLRSIGLSSSDFNQTVIDSIQRSAMNDLIALSAYTPSVQIKEAYIQDHGSKKFSVLTVSYDDCLHQVKKKGCTPQQVQAFFENATRESKRYYQGEKRAGIVSRCHARDYGIRVSDEDIERYYHEHKKEEFVDKPAQVQVRHLVVKTAEQAEQLRDELMRDPSLFEKKVAEHSLDTHTVQSGGLLPLFSRNTTQEPMREKAAFLLKNDGDISAVVPTSEGFEILQRVRRVPATYTSLTKAKASISTLLINKAFAAAIDQDMKQLTEALTHDKGALDQYVIAHKGSLAQQAASENDGSMLMTQFFNLKQGQATYYVEGDTLTILMLTGIEPAHVPPLSSVYAQVQADYYKEQARSLMRETMDKVRSERATTSPDQLSKRYNLKLITTPYMTKGDEQMAAWCRQKELPLDYMLQMEKTGVMAQHEFQGNGYLIELDEIRAIDSEDFARHTQELLSRLDRENSEHVSAGFVASLYRHATIKQNESLATT